MSGTTSAFAWSRSTPSMKPGTWSRGILRWSPNGCASSSEARPPARRLVSERPSRFAVAAHFGPLPHLGFGDHAATDPGAGGHPLLPALPGALSHRGGPGVGPGGGVGRPRFGADARALPRDSAGVA